jgi:hypothetical protein
MRKWPKYPRFWGEKTSISPDWWMDHFFQNFDIYCKAKGSKKKNRFLDVPHFDYTNLVKRSQLGRVSYNCVTNYANCFFQWSFTGKNTHTHFCFSCTHHLVTSGNFCEKIFFQQKESRNLILNIPNFQQPRINIQNALLSYNMCIDNVAIKLRIQKGRGKNKTKKKVELATFTLCEGIGT